MSKRSQQVEEQPSRPGRDAASAISSSTDRAIEMESERRPSSHVAWDPEPVERALNTSEIRDGMRIDWDTPIRMDDGVTLRADVFRPVADGRYPVNMTHGPYAKGLAFQEGYAGMWVSFSTRHPAILAGSSNKYQNWETADPEKWVPDAYVCVRVDSRGAARSPGYLAIFSPRETRDY